MQIRKQEEAKFHDSLRTLKKPPQDYEQFASNKKFYSVTRQSRNFLHKWLIQKCRNKKVLDYCCGNGETSLFLAQHEAETTGIDISPVSIENCKRNVIREKVDKHARFFVMDAENLEFEDNYFDIIFCSGVLHHLDIKKAYPELARVIKPDGEIICNEPLIHNPFFQLYRKLTPRLRTEWETQHILNKNDIMLANKYFSKVEINFFHLTTLLAVIFRNFRGFNFILGMLEKTDSILLKLPFLKWWAWQIIFILSQPKKNIKPSV